jgi:hypothetical protein
VNARIAFISTAPDETSFASLARNLNLRVIKSTVVSMAVFKSSRMISCVTKITIIQECNGATFKNNNGNSSSSANTK